MVDVPQQFSNIEYWLDSHLDWFEWVVHVVSPAANPSLAPSFFQHPLSAPLWQHPSPAPLFTHALPPPPPLPSLPPHSFWQPASPLTPEPCKMSSISQSLVLSDYPNLISLEGNTLHYDSSQSSECQSLLNRFDMSPNIDRSDLENTPHSTHSLADRIGPSLDDPPSDRLDSEEWLACTLPTNQDLSLLFLSTIQLLISTLALSYYLEGTSPSLALPITA